MADSTKALDPIAREIAEICRTKGSEAAYRIGACIIEKIYDGDIDRWRRDGLRDVSYRLLAAHGDIPISASALCRAVGIYVLRERLGIDSRKFVTRSHLQEVLPLPPEQQARLLAQAERDRWSIRRLRAEIASQRVASRRRAATSWLRAIRRVRTIVESFARLPRVKDEADARVVAGELESVAGRIGEARDEITGRTGPGPEREPRVRPDPPGRRDSFIGYISGSEVDEGDDADVPSSRRA